MGNLIQQETSDFVYFDKMKSVSESIVQLEFAHKNLMEYLSKSIDLPLYSPFAWTYILTLCKVDDALGHGELKSLYSALGVQINEIK